MGRLFIRFKERSYMEDKKELIVIELTEKNIESMVYEIRE